MAGGEASWGGRLGVAKAHGAWVVAAWGLAPARVQALVQALVQVGQAPAAFGQAGWLVEGVVKVLVDWAGVQEECWAACWLGAAGCRRVSQCSNHSR